MYIELSTKPPWINIIVSLFTAIKTEAFSPEGGMYFQRKVFGSVFGKTETFFRL